MLQLVRRLEPEGRSIAQDVTSPMTSVLSLVAIYFSAYASIRVRNTSFLLHPAHS